MQNNLIYICFFFVFTIVFSNGCENRTHDIQILTERIKSSDFPVNEYVLPKLGEDILIEPNVELLRVLITPDDFICDFSSNFLLSCQKEGNKYKVQLKIVKWWSDIRDSTVFYDTYTAVIDSFDFNKYKKMGSAIQSLNENCSYCPNLTSGSIVKFEYYYGNTDAVYFKRNTVSKESFEKIDSNSRTEILMVEELIYNLFNEMKYIFPNQIRIFAWFITPHFVLSDE